jgi:hypothetical protein
VAAVVDAPGNFVIVVGDDEAKRGLRHAEGAIDDWLYEMADKVAFQASDRLIAHAPGNIDDLVRVDLVDQVRPGVFESKAGVVPATFPSYVGRGVTSDSAEYPVFVDQGSGIYGARRTPVVAPPGNLMGPIRYKGRTIYIKSFKGQIAQHFSDKAFDDTVSWVPAQIELALPDLERKIKT